MATRNYLPRYFGDQGLLKRALPGFAVRPQQQTVAAAIDAALAAPRRRRADRGRNGGRKDAGLSHPRLAARQAGLPHRRLDPYARPASPARRKRCPPRPVRLEVARGSRRRQRARQLSVSSGYGRRAGRPVDRRRPAVRARSRPGAAPRRRAMSPNWTSLIPAGPISGPTPTPARSRSAASLTAASTTGCGARRRKPSILLVNHALFFSDLAVRRSGEPDAKLLPDYDFVVFDEAHHLETAAAAAFGIAFSSARLPVLMDKAPPRRPAARHEHGPAEGHRSRSRSRSSTRSCTAAARSSLSPTSCAASRPCSRARAQAAATGAAAGRAAHRTAQAGHGRPARPERPH